MKKRQTISVIIPTRNRPKMLGCVLSALKAQMPRVAEVIVVDTSNRAFQKETKGVVYAFSSLGAMYRRLPYGSASRARNQGIKYSSGDILAFLDDDSVPDPGWTSAIIRATKVGPFWFRGLCVDATTDVSITHNFYTWYKELTSEKFEHQWSSYGRWKGYRLVSHFQAGNFFVSRKTLLQIQPVFDEHLFPFMAEEAELSLRLRESGHQILFVPQAKIKHYFLRLGYVSFVLYSAFWYGRSLAILSKRNKLFSTVQKIFHTHSFSALQRKRVKELRKIVSGGYALFREKYARGAVYNLKFLFICLSYVLCWLIGYFYGEIEYVWRNRVGKLFLQ